MLTVQYNGPELTIGHAVWYPGETRPATAEQLAAWQREHGDVFVVAGAPAQGWAVTETAAATEPKGHKK